MEKWIIVIAVSQILIAVFFTLQKIMEMYQASQNEKFAKLAAGVSGFLAGGLLQLLKNIKEKEDARTNGRNNKHGKDNGSNSPGKNPDKKEESTVV